ncbi:hypothetical protein Y1Q_0009478 [Alligator mississippiensis]|uniref:Uncharacterized protein n=1 Tax=Alligator mississippiensis TaxID=8496 RepID=A0A151M7K2_ALLMI|nr:hypothetical protein Y1Q_0009478 [Alligator mississippiensis]
MWRSLLHVGVERALWSGYSNSLQTLLPDPCARVERIQLHLPVEQVCIRAKHVQDHVLKWLMIINEQLAIAKRERQCM